MIPNLLLKLNAKTCFVFIQRLTEKNLKVERELEQAEEFKKIDE